MSGDATSALPLEVAKCVKAAKGHEFAFLGVDFLNDNDTYEPTNDKERARLKALETSLIEKLTQSGQYKFVPVAKEMRETIEKGQSIGDCGGYEIDYGNALFGSKRSRT